MCHTSQLLLRCVPLGGGVDRAIILQQLNEVLLLVVELGQSFGIGRLNGISDMIIFVSI